jgi:microcystin-dependent protein
MACKAAASQTSAATAPAVVALIEAEGWLLCDGRFLGVSQYPLLFGALGYRYGQGTDANAQNTFRIPDYRGLFLRGVDAGSGMDSQAAARTGPRGSGTDSGVGSLQCDAFQDHTHDFDAVKTTTAGDQGVVGGLATSPRPTTSPDAPARFGPETRPKNVAVNYIIKYR